MNNTTQQSSADEYEHEHLEAATRIQNTLIRRLQNEPYVTVDKPRIEQYNDNMRTPVINLSLHVDVTMENGILRDIEGLVDGILSQTFLYNGTEYTFVDESLRSRNIGAEKLKPEHEITGSVKVVPTNNTSV